MTAHKNRTPYIKEVPRIPPLPQHIEAQLLPDKDSLCIRYQNLYLKARFIVDQIVKKLP